MEKPPEGFSPVVSPTEEVYRFLMHGVSTFRGPKWWIEAFHAKFTSELRRMLIINYSWMEGGVDTDGAHFRTYKLLNQSQQVH